MAEYIEREAVLALAKDICVLTKWDSEYHHRSIDPGDVRELPAADVRHVVRGKWRLYSPLTDTYECDKCGYQVIDESFRTNFCPNCGADMRPTPMSGANGEGNHENRTD